MPSRLSSSSCPSDERRAAVRRARSHVALNAARPDVGPPNERSFPWQLHKTISHKAEARCSRLC